jgi:hypothetical protein
MESEAPEWEKPWNARGAISDESNAKFVRDLQESTASVELVAGWLRSRGHKLRVNPIRIRPSFEERRNYSDSGDIILLDPERRVEVTHRKLRFTCRSDFPLDALFVEKVAKYERRSPEPYAYVALNKPMTHAAIVLCSTRPNWFVDSWHDDCLVPGQRYPCYACPKEHLSFVRIAAPKAPARSSIFADNEFGF